jgi:hypothetical protein
MKLKATVELDRINLQLRAGGSPDTTMQGMFLEFAGIPFDAETDEAIAIHGAERLFLVLQIFQGKDEGDARVVPMTGEDEDTLLVTLKAPDPFFARLLNVREDEALELELTVANVGKAWPMDVREGICHQYDLSIVPHSSLDEDEEEVEDEEEEEA